MTMKFLKDLEPYIRIRYYYNKRISIYKIKSLCKVESYCRYRMINNIANSFKSMFQYNDNAQQRPICIYANGKSRWR